MRYETLAVNESTKLFVSFIKYATNWSIRTLNNSYSTYIAVEDDHVVYCHSSTSYIRDLTSNGSR